MKYVPSALIGRLSKSAGSTTAGHNKFGAYLRNRVIPTNPQTSFQLAARDDLSDISTSWRGLTAAQREGWIALGDQMSRTDSLGEAYTLTGSQAYISVNRNRLTVGEAISSNAPALQLPDSIVSLTPSMAAALGTVSLAFTPTPAGDNMLIFATAPISAGRNFASTGEYKLIAVVDGEGTSPQDLAAAYTARFGSFTGKAGQKVIFRVVMVNTAGFASPPASASAIIAA